jgi:hypothetical protein
VKQLETFTEIVQVSSKTASTLQRYGDETPMRVSLAMQ